MKYLAFIVLMFCLVNSCKTRQIANTAPNNIAPSSNGGTLITDTASYIRTQIIDHKEKFTGMPLSVLLDSLLIQVQSFTRGIVHSNINISGDISLSFVNSIETRSRSIQRQKPVLLTVIWATPLPLDSVNYLGRKFKNDWNAEVEG